MTRDNALAANLAYLAEQIKTELSLARSYKRTQRFALASDCIAKAHKLADRHELLVRGIQA